MSEQEAQKNRLRMSIERLTHSMLASTMPVSDLLVQAFDYIERKFDVHLTLINAAKYDDSALKQEVYNLKHSLAQTQQKLQDITMLVNQYSTHSALYEAQTNNLHRRMKALVEGKPYEERAGTSPGRHRKPDPQTGGGEDHGN